MIIYKIKSVRSDPSGKTKFSYLSYLVIFLMVVSAPSICFSEPDGKVWEQFKPNYYYNKTNLTKSSDIISVWTYTIESENNKRNMVERWKNFDLEKSVKYQHYDHTIFLDEFDCKKKLTKRKEYIWYDDKGKVLDRYTNKNCDWKSIIPDSAMESLYGKICITPKKSLKK